MSGRAHVYSRLYHKNKTAGSFGSRSHKRLIIPPRINGARFDDLPQAIITSPLFNFIRSWGDRAIVAVAGSVGLHVAVYEMTAINQSAPFTYHKVFHFSLLNE